MRTIEEIATAFESIGPSDGSRWYVQTLVPTRLHVSRSVGKEYTVFIEGNRDSFGALPPLTGIEHSDSVVALPESRRFGALRVASSDPVHGNRVMAHIAYELARRLEEDPSLDNATLFAQVEWVLPLLGAAERLLTSERQRGLVGECMLLRQLLLVARRLHLGPAAVLGRWWGHSSSRRDFAAAGIAIEVKTTAQNTRQHHITSIEQLDPESPAEEVYVYSLGVKSDPTSQKKLPHFVSDVEEQLVDQNGRSDPDAIQRFRGQLSGYGFDARHEGFYLSGAGFLKPHLAPALFRETELDRLRLSSFVMGALPGMVASVSYVLDIKSDPIPEANVDSVFARLLTLPEAGYQ